MHALLAWPTIDGVSDPRPAGGARGRPCARPRRAEATRALGRVGVGAKSDRLQRPPDRGALGGRAAPDCLKGAAGVRLAAQEAAWQGAPADEGARLPATGRAGRARPGAFPATLQREQSSRTAFPLA